MYYNHYEMTCAKTGGYLGECVLVKTGNPIIAAQDMILEGMFGEDADLYWDEERAGNVVGFWGSYGDEHIDRALTAIRFSGPYLPSMLILILPQGSR